MSSTHQLVMSRPAAGASAQNGQYLIFTLNAESFAIDILNIKEIIEYGQLTEVPMMPETVRGVINLRGAVVPVIDLSARFGRAATQVGRRTCIVIVEIEQETAQGSAVQTLGIVVDAVNAVTDIEAQDIEPAPSFGARIRTDFIAGMARQDGRFVIILNIDHVLSMDELANLAALADTPTETSAAGTAAMA